MEFLDEIDKKIIDILKQDSRTSYITIAKQLGLTEGAVRKRVKKLIDMEIIKKFTIKVSQKDLARAFILISTETKIPTPLISKMLRKVKGVTSVYEITGQFDILAMVQGESNTDINRCIDQIRKIDGVLSTNTVIVLRSGED